MELISDTQPIMKKTYTIIVILLLLFLVEAKAQTRKNIVAQKDYNVMAFETLDSLGVQEQPDFERVVLQIRFQISNYATGIHKLFLIDSLKTGKWRGQSIEYYAYNAEHTDYRNILKKNLELDNSWTTAFQNIKKRDYLNLPSQKEAVKKISNRNKSNTALTLVVADGTSYFLAFITRKKSRRIHFSNPESYADFFKVEGDDRTIFNDYLELLQILSVPLDFQAHLTKPK